MKKIKKPLSIVLALMMVVSLFAIVPITASAAEETSTVHSNTDKLSNHGIQNLQYGEHLDFDGTGLPWGTFVAPPGKVFTKIVSNGANRGAINWTGSADRVNHDNMGGEWYIDWETDEEGFRPFTISFTLADAAPPTYTVTWKNGETTLKTDTVEEGTAPAYSGDVPEKAEDENNTYTFSGWTDGTTTYGATDTLPAVTGDITYTATYTSTRKNITGTVGTASYTIDENGVLTIGSGSFTGFQFSVEFDSRKANIKNVIFNSGATLKGSAVGLFGKWTALESVDLTNAQANNVTSMDKMFNGCTALTNVKFGVGFDTSKVTSMYFVFKDCASLTSIDFTGFNTAEVTKMSGMFTGCKSLITLDISSFNTANVTDMSTMFSSCGKLTTIFVGSNWNTDAVTSSGYMFSGDTKLKGSQGTTYSYKASDMDKSRAHIDGGLSNPGYLTDKNHTHSFTYALSEDHTTITATCTGTGTCNLNGTGENSVSIKISVPTTLTVFAKDNDPETIQILNKDIYRARIDGVAAFNAATGYAVRDTWKDNDTQDDTHVFVQYYKLENDTETFLGTEPPCKEAGNYRAKITIDNQTAYVDYSLNPKKLFPQHSVSLGGDIGVNFYINSAYADFANAQSAVVKFTWDGGGKENSKEVNLKELTPDDDGYYKATVDVVAAQMAHKIHAEVYLNGEKLDQTDDYSVQDYAEAVYNNPTAYDDKGKPRELQELAKALLNYGAQAQIVFDEYLVEKPAPANTVKTVGQTDFSGITAEQIKAAVNGEASNLNTAAAAFDAEFYTSSLIYLSRNTLRLYFTPASKTVGALDGKGFSGNLSDYYYYVEKENIAAAELDEQQSFTIGDKTFTFSALDYAKAVVNSDMGGNQKDLAKALYLYNKAANAYFDDAPAHVHTTATRQDNVVNATCTTAGSYDEVTYCSECNEVISTNHVDVPATGHTIVSVAEVPATTEAAGMAAHYECSVCHKLFSDAEGNNETTAEALVIPQIVENVVDLSTLTGAYEAKDGDVLSGILSGDKKITIADGATITLRDANITLSTNAQYAGITPVGDATILLEGKNTVKGGYENFPGVFVPVGKTLTIDGTGSLTASSGGNEDRKYSCGIGGGYEIAAGNIVINGGTITANGGDWAAGIGSGYEATCGNILIAGGTVTATGGESAAGIGSGLDSTCGNITIAGTVTQVTATKGEGAEASIGAGESGTCGTVTIEDNSKVTQN